MHFGMKRRLEEDLERIREANLSDEKKAALQKTEQQREEHAHKQLESWTFRDTLAMTIAALWVILPYFLIFFSVIGLILVFVFFVL